jgi:hypothetical protein
MEDSQPHEMQLVRTHSSGAEEWYCPTCGRRFLMHWPPTYKKIVLEVGDEYAAHVGGKGAARTDPASLYAADETEAELFPQPTAASAALEARPAPVEEVGPVPITDELRPWLRWMSSAGLADDREAV